LQPATSAALHLADADDHVLTFNGIDFAVVQENVSLRDEVLYMQDKVARLHAEKRCGSTSASIIPLHCRADALGSGVAVSCESLRFFADHMVYSLFVSRVSVPTE
jgi:hypothetical protein